MGMGLQSLDIEMTGTTIELQLKALIPSIGYTQEHKWLLMVTWTLEVSELYYQRMSKQF